MNLLINICALISISCLASPYERVKRPQMMNKRVENSETKIYKNNSFLISFNYPATWTKNINYIERYDGEGGFFQVIGIASMGKNIDQVVEQEVSHQVKPFGSSPQIVKLMIGEQPASMIIPSMDQDKAFENGAGLIVKLKNPVTMGQYLYDYIIVFADKNHIQAIAESFKFTDELPNQSSEK